MGGEDVKPEKWGIKVVVEGHEPLQMLVVSLWFVGVGGGWVGMVGVGKERGRAQGATP